jgi:glycosyltransferase involved in cell wall biosynthesis
MRLLYLTHQYFPRHVGGTEVYTRGLIRRAIAAGHQACVISCHESPSGDPADFGVQRTEHEGVPVVEIHFNLSVTADPARCEYDNPFTAGLVAAEVAAFRPDVVHVMHALKLSGAAVRACIDAGCPVLVTLCDFWFLCPRHTLLKPDGTVCSGPDRPLKCLACCRQLHGVAPPPRDWRDGLRWLRDLWTIQRRTAYLRRTLQGARQIVALSHFQKNLFVANGYPGDRIEVIDHGLEIDAPAGPRPPRRSEPLRVGFIGSLVPFKGAHVLLEALAREPSLPVECRIHGPLGGDPYTARLREMAGRDPRVRLMGGFEPQELGRVLDEMDLLAVPALWYENNPLVVKAALHRGVPVLASRIGSLEEMLRPRGAAWLVEPGDVAAWAAALRRLSAAPLPVCPPLPVKSIDDNARELFALYRRVA